MVQKLFDDGDSDGVADDISKIEIDHAFARKFEYNKRREDLQRLEELKKRGEISDSADDDSSSSEEEDPEEILGSKKSDLKFYDAIVRVKRNDPIIYQKNAKLYSSSSEEEEEEEEDEKKDGKNVKKSKKDKPLYIKDVVAKHLLEEGPNYGDDEDWKPDKSRSKSYFEEQEDIKNAFLEAADETHASDGEDLFVEKKGILGNSTADGDDGEIHEKLDEVFGEDEDLDEKDAFLKSFLKNKMWVGRSDGPKEEDLVVVSEEEDEIEKQEKYEAEFNFRFQEGAGDRVLAHSRVIEGSIRKKTNSRKLQRKSKEERFSQVEIERREELKRLKNIKKKEIQEKLVKIRKIAGITKSDECALDEDDLEEDFDPEEYDRKMKKVFDAEYYGAEDDLAKPDFDEEDELLGLPKDWSTNDNSDGFLAVRSKILKGEPSSEPQAEDESESKRKKKQKISLHQKVELEKALEEYYKLDYEDTIGDLKTRFRYKSVPENRYGLSAEEILLADDKELNQYVSLKKIAPYREEEWKVTRQKRYHQKIKKKLLVGNADDDKVKREKEKKVKKREREEGGSEKGDSRRSKRRQRQRELKVSQSRLAVYGKTQQKA